MSKKADRNSFYVTTPIYYVNDRPHIGHAYTTVLADVLARYHRLFGDDTFFLTGTDEHGQKVRQAALKAGISSLEQANRTVVRFQDLWRRLGITNDDFIRTTESRHTTIVQKILQDLFDRDEIYRAEYDGWYCVTCERFYVEKDLVEGKCPESGCGRQVEKIKEANYFFRMSRYQEWLISHIESHPEFIQPDFRRNETLGFLRKPLNDLCISRPKSRMDWGIELPFDRDYVTYVWFDALLNYVTAIGYGSDEARFKRWWPATCQLVGKDILTTHTVYWPTMLKAMGVELPQMVFAHGWWLIGRDKMSKTAGNVVNPMEFVDKYGVDAFRYFLMAEMSLGQDASFTEEAFVRRYNADLANDLGNMLSRVHKLVVDVFSGKIPSPGASGADELDLKAKAESAMANVMESVRDMTVDGGLAGVADLVRQANKYLEKKQPWMLAKQTDKAPLGTVLYHGAEILRLVSRALSPVMPGKMADLAAALGLSEIPEADGWQKWGRLEAGAKTGDMTHLFPRITHSANKSAEGKEAKAMTSEVQGGPAAADGMDISEFLKIHLRTAKVLEATKVEGADKLLCLQVDVGGEKRQIVAGIAKSYAPEQLVGKTVVIVANLKTAKIRGVESKGMLLAASSGDVLHVITVDGDVQSGLEVR